MQYRVVGGSRPQAIDFVRVAAEGAVAEALIVDAADPVQTPFFGFSRTLSMPVTSTISQSLGTAPMSMPHGLRLRYWEQFGYSFRLYRSFGRTSNVAS